MNKPKKIKFRSDLESERTIDLDSDDDTIDGVNTIDLTKQSPLKTLSSQELNIIKTNTSDKPVQNKRQKQKQIVPSKLLIDQKLLKLSNIEITQTYPFYNPNLYSFSVLQLVSKTEKKT